MSSLRIADTETEHKQEQEDTAIPEYRDEVVEIERFQTQEKRTETPSDSANEEDNAQDTKSSDSYKLNIKSDDEGEDTATLPLKKKSNDEKNAYNEDKNEKPPMYIFPILRLKLAWIRSSSLIEFIIRVIAIAFSTLGWLCCVGGIPLMSIAMLIIGSIYVNDCKVQPNIPVYLIVSGVFGTLQHFMAVWIKYIPKNSTAQGSMRTYRAYCKSLDCVIEIFLIIWFVLGCVWVYGVPEEIDFRDEYKDEYCNKTVYYFAFWLLNISFILLLLLVVVTIFAIVCVVVGSPKDAKVEEIQ